MARYRLSDGLISWPEPGESIDHLGTGVDGGGILVRVIRTDAIAWHL